MKSEADGNGFSADFCLVVDVKMIKTNVIDFKQEQPIIKVNVFN